MARPGDYRHVIRIEVQKTVQDLSGQPLLQWETYGGSDEIRAAIQRTPGNEVFAAQQRHARVPTIFRIRYIDGVSPGMRIVWENRVFDIKSVVDQGRREEQVITTEEWVGETAGGAGTPYVAPLVTLAASNVIVTPVGGIVSTDAQAALAELDTEMGTHTHPDADEATAGFMGIGAQTFAGLKRFVAGLLLSAKLTIDTITSGRAVEIPPDTRIGFNGSAANSELYFDSATALFIATRNLRLPAYLEATSGNAVEIRGRAANGATQAVADCYTNMTSGKLFSFRNFGVEKAYFDFRGGLIITGPASGEVAVQIPSGARAHFNGGTGNAYLTNSGANALNTPTQLGIGSGLQLLHSGYSGGHSAWVASHGTGWSIGAGGVGHDFDTSMSGAGVEGYVMRWKRNTVAVARVATTGRIDQSGTDSSATPGAATINKPTGISAIAGGATTVTITNSLATATSRVMITWLGDLGAQTKVPWVTRAAGSFTVNVDAAPVGAVAFAWEISEVI